MTEYYVFEIENTKYKLMLDKLCNLSDRFCLVEPIADTKDFPDILPEPKGELEKFLIERKRTYVWPGTKIKLRSKNKEAIQHFYKCSKASIDILKRYSDFFQYEDQMDIAFFAKENCVLYTISHEEIIVVDMKYWNGFFKKIECKLIKKNM